MRIWKKTSIAGSSGVSVADGYRRKADGLVVKTLKALRLVTSSSDEAPVTLTLDAVNLSPMASDRASDKSPAGSHRTLNDCFVDSDEAKAIVTISKTHMPTFVRVSAGFRRLVSQIFSEEVVLNEPHWAERAFPEDLLDIVRKAMMMLKDHGFCESEARHKDHTVCVKGHPYNDKEGLYILYFTPAIRKDTALIGPDFEESLESKCIIRSDGLVRITRISQGYKRMFLDPLNIEFDPSDHAIFQRVYADSDFMRDADDGWFESFLRVGDAEVHAFVTKLAPSLFLVQFRNESNGSVSSARERASEISERELALSIRAKQQDEREKQLREREKKIREREEDVTGSPKSARSTSSRASLMRLRDLSFEDSPLELTLTNFESFTEPPHMSDYLQLLEMRATRPINTVCDMAEYFLLMKSQSLRNEATTTSIMAVKQLSRFNLCSQKTPNGYMFFNPILRSMFGQEGTDVIYIFGEEHKSYYMPDTSILWCDSLTSFYKQSGMYSTLTDAQWLDKFGRYEITQVVLDPSDSRIIGAQTSQLMYTGYDPIFYISLIYVVDIGSMEEKLSKALSSDLIGLLQSIISPQGVGHLLTQSVGWTYKLDQSGKVTKQQSGQKLWKNGRYYWMKHLIPAPVSEYATHFGAQLCLLPDFVDGSCCFMHKLFRAA